MPLNNIQRNELEATGAKVVSFKLMAQPGADKGAAIRGFNCGDITRGDVEDWLADKARDEERQQARILQWARIAGWSGIVAAVIGALGVAVAVLHI
jgi:hypothetical protein